MVDIHLVTSISAPIQRCFDLSRSIDLHLLGSEDTGEQAVDGVTSGLIGLGEQVRWRAKHFGIWQHLTSRITAFDSPTFFQDTMVEGAFHSMRHDHLFEPVSAEQTIMRDRFRFEAPIPVLGLVAEQLFLRRYMTSFLRQRNEMLKQVAESTHWMRYLPQSAS